MLVSFLERASAISVLSPVSSMFIFLSIRSYFLHVYYSRDLDLIFSMLFIPYSWIVFSLILFRFDNYYIHLVTAYFTGEENVALMGISLRGIKLMTQEEGANDDFDIHDINGPPRQVEDVSLPKSM